MSADVAGLAEQFRTQATACASLGSAIHADLLGRIAVDLGAGGPCARVLAPHATMRFGLAAPLRFAGALHRRALDGRAPQLAAHFPSCVGAAARNDPDSRWAAALAVIDSDGDAISAEMDGHVQTNEVGRSAALIVGLAHVAHITGLPISLREIGTSAGLNLRLDQFGYYDGAAVHGDAGAPLRLSDRWRGDVRPLRDDPTWRVPEVVDRAGVDPAPIDPTTDEGRIRLLGFLWPEQVDRIERTNAAIEVARRVPARVDRMPTAPWLATELDRRSTGAAMVIAHSIVWQYIPKDERPEIRRVIEAAGGAATPERPVAWLAMEPNPEDLKEAALTLRLWDGGDHDGTPVLLARCGYHGQDVTVEATPVRVDSVRRLGDAGDS